MRGLAAQKNYALYRLGRTFERGGVPCAAPTLARLASKVRRQTRFESSLLRRAFHTFAGEAILCVCVSSYSVFRDFRLEVTCVIRGL